MNVNDIAVFYDEKIDTSPRWAITPQTLSRHFWRIAIVTGLLPSRDSKMKEQ